MKSHHPLTLAAAACLAVAPLLFTGCASGPVTGMNSASLDRKALAAESRAALDNLCRMNSLARNLRPAAKGILVFPDITKGGFVVSGMGGNGVAIRPDGTIRDFYQTVGLSYGLQAGIQGYGYAVFLMDDDAVRQLNRSHGWEIGSNPNVVVVDAGRAASLSTTSINRGTYVFFFNQRGLMGGVDLQGTKITRL